MRASLQSWKFEITKLVSPHFESGKWKQPVLLLVLLCFPIPLLAQVQVTQPARYEYERKGSDHQFIIISLGEKGLALVRDTEKFDDGNKNWELILLDSALHETFVTKIAIDQRMNILGHDFRDGNLYLLFHEPESAGRTLNLTEIRADQTIKQHKIKPEVSVHFTHFYVVKEKAIFGGYINKQPAVFMYDIANENLKVIPGINEPNVELLDVRTNSNDSFNALLLQGRSSLKNRKIVVKTFDEGGALLVDDVIPIDENKTVLEAITSTLVRDEMVIIGTWTFSGKQAAGIFSVVVDPFKEQTVNYYDFAQLNHFLDYLKPKRVAKIKAKAEWRRSVDKQPEFRINLSTVKIDETKEGFSFLGETYEASTSYYRGTSPYGYSSYPPTSYNPYGYYSPFGLSSMAYRPYPYSYYNTNPVINDMRVMSSAVMYFDSHGKLVSDFSLKFPEIKVASREQVSDFIHKNGLTTIVCKDEKEVIVKISDANGEVLKEEKFKPELKNKDEIIRSETREDSSIRAWYGKFFYVYGYHTIRDEKEKKSRDVFYVNKIKVD